MLGERLASRLACIGELSAAGRKALCSLRGEVREIGRYEDVLRIGDHPSHIVLLIDGFLQRYTDLSDGARQIHSFYFPGDVPSAETLHIDHVDSNLAAVIDSRIGLISHEALNRVMEQHRDVLKLMWRETLVQGATFREWLARNSILPAHVSAAHFFCEMLTRAKAAGLAKGNCANVPITQQELSDALGLTAVHVNRTLMVLRATGAMEWRNGRLNVTDWNRLRDMADFDPAYLHLRTHPTH